MKLTVYKQKNGVNKNWDDVNFETDIETVVTIDGESNTECEEKATDMGYADSDIYGWTYE